MQRVKVVNVFPPVSKSGRHTTNTVLFGCPYCGREDYGSVLPGKEKALECEACGKKIILHDLKKQIGQ